MGKYDKITTYSVKLYFYCLKNKQNQSAVLKAHRKIITTLLESYAYLYAPTQIGIKYDVKNRHNVNCLPHEIVLNVKNY